MAGTGRPLRQFLYSDDLARLMAWVVESYQGSDSIILAPSAEDEISIGEVAGLIADQFHYRDRLQFDPSQSDGQYRKTADNAQLVQHYGCGCSLSPPASARL